MNVFRRLAVFLAVSAMAIVSVGAPSSAQPPPIPEFANTECPEMTDSIVRLYSAYFLRPPDQEGFQGWRLLYEGPDWSLARISGFFATSDEFVGLYGSLSEADFVDLIYQNLFGREADPAGRAFWVDELESGRRDRGTVMLNFSESEEYVILTRSITPLAGYFNSYPTGTTFQCGLGSGRVEVGSGIGRYVDIAFYNPTLGEVTYGVDSIQNGQQLDEFDNRTLGALDTDSYFNLELNVTTAFVFDLPPDIGWMVVVSPTPLPEERGGWIRTLQGLQSIE